MIKKEQLKKIASLRARHWFSGGRSNLVPRIASVPFASLRAPRNDNSRIEDDNLGQATLEFTLIFVIMVALLMGLLGLWKWSSDNIIRRQVAYNGSRKEAGSITRGPIRPDKVEKWSGADKITDKDTYFFNR